MVERLYPTEMGHRGDAIAASPQGPLYIPYALPGEEIEADPVEGHPDRRHLLRVVRPSAERVAALCPHFGVCGGCALQHWREDRYRQWKHALVGQALAAAGLSVAVAPLVEGHGEGRRRIVLHARMAHDVLQVGFAAQRAHAIVAIDRCPVLAPGLAGAVPAAWALAEALLPLAKPLDLQFTATDIGLDVDLRGSGPLSPARMRTLADIAGRHRLARLTRHGEPVMQAAVPTLRIGRATVALPPGTFLQATALGEDTLARLVLEHCAGAQAVVDLFAGIGPFALRLAERARVTAVDADAPAMAALSAAAKAPGLKPLATLTRDLFRRPMVAPELTPFEVAVFDPPRQGAQAQARALAASSVPRLVAVSCNPATFARDARILCEGGYEATRVTPVDQFRYSAHVEIVACFTRPVI